MFDKKSKYAGSFRRASASAIDMLIANIIRMIMFTILGTLFVEKQLINFRADFQTRFDSNIIGNDPEKIKIILLYKIQFIQSF